MTDKELGKDRHDLIERALRIAERWADIGNDMLLRSQFRNMADDVRAAHAIVLKGEE